MGGSRGARDFLHTLTAFIGRSVLGVDSALRGGGLARHAMIERFVLKNHHGAVVSGPDCLLQHIPLMGLTCDAASKQHGVEADEAPRRSDIAKPAIVAEILPVNVPPLLGDRDFASADIRQAIADRCATSPR